MRPTAAVTLMVLLVVAGPAAFAGWASKGEVEPDTRFDVGWVWASPPPQGSTTNVYFNGFAGAWAGSPTSLNPNHATLDGRIQPVPFAPSALLGLWVDCNRDAYIGDAATGALEYSTMVLPPGGPCPVVEDPGVLAHNDGRWVQEFFPIGYDDVRTPSDENPFNIPDQGARVWADWGAPGAPQAGSCGDLPLPRGTLRSGGGILGLVDCRLGYAGLATFSTLADAAGLSQLSFSDAPREHPERSSSLLNAQNPWGHERDPSMVRAVDCEAEASEVGPSDPTDDGSGNGQLHRVTIPVVGFGFNATDDRGRFVNATMRPVDPGVDPAGSPAGTVNDTQAQTTDCARDDRDSVLTYEGERRGSDGAGPYVLETASDPADPSAKRSRTDFAFTFEEGARMQGGTVAGLLGRRWQNDAGTGAAFTVGMWTSTTRETRDPVIRRSDLGAAPVTLVTFYAHITRSLHESANMRFPSALALYGLDCGVYECDATRWWVNAEGTSVVPRDARLGATENPAIPAADPSTEIGVRPGQPYVLRDTDCYDQSVAPARGLGLQWGALTSTSCA